MADTGTEESQLQKRQKRNSFYSLNQQRVTSSPTALEGRGETESKRCLRTCTSTQKPASPGEKGLSTVQSYVAANYINQLHVPTPYICTAQNTNIPKHEPESRRDQVKINILCLGTSLVVQWVRLQASTAGGTDSIPGWGTKIPHALWQKKKKKNSLFKKAPLQK